MGATLTSIFDNLSSSYSGLFRLLYVLFNLMGVIAIVWGISNLRKGASDGYRSDGGAHYATQSLISILIGAVFVYMPELLKTVAYTVFLNGNGTVGLLDYQTPPNTYASTLISLRTFIQLFGLYMFGKGWWSLRHVGLYGQSQHHSFTSAVVRIFAGICLVHIIDFLKMLSISFGLAVIGAWLTELGVA